MNTSSLSITNLVIYVSYPSITVNRNVGSITLACRFAASVDSAYWTINHYTLESIIGDHRMEEIEEGIEWQLTMEIGDRSQGTYACRSTDNAAEIVVEIRGKSKGRCPKDIRLTNQNTEQNTEKGRCSKDIRLTDQKTDKLVRGIFLTFGFLKIDQPENQVETIIDGIFLYLQGVPKVTPPL